jgi:hypothetical protein
VPTGWKVPFLDEVTRVNIKPWGMAKFELVAELMNDTGLRDALLPFTVEVVGGGGRPTAADSPLDPRKRSWPSSLTSAHLTNGTMSRATTVAFIASPMVITTLPGSSRR